MDSRLRKSLIIVVAVILAAYILFAGVLYRPACDRVLSHHPVIVVKDSAEHTFVTAAEVQQLVKRHGLRLEGIPASEIQLDSVERVVKSHPMVRQAECCLLPSGKVKITVTQRAPVMRLLPSEGDRHYIDEDGLPMEIAARYKEIHTMDLPTATGHISMNDTLLLGKLYYMAMQLHKSPYWSRLITKIDVDSKGRWSFRPSEGNFYIRFGYPDGFSVKMGAIRSFYDKILPIVGPDYYSSLNLEFKDQLICTRRKH